MPAVIEAEGTLNIVNCDLINDKNLTVITLGTCILNVLCL